MQQNKLILLSSIIFLLVSPGTALAIASASPSPTPSPSPTESSVNQVTENLKERLKETLQSEDTEPALPTYRAFVGQIQDVIQKTIIVTTKDGKNQVILNDETILLRNPGNVTIKEADLRLEDYIIAMGTLKEDDVLVGKRIIVSTSPLTETAKTSGYGQITEIKKSTLTLTSAGEDIILSLNSSTQLKSKDNPDLALTDLELNQRLIYTAEQDDEDNIATVLMLIK